MTRYGWIICIGISMLYLCINQVDIAPIDQCSQTYNASSGLTCSYCPPGTHKHSDCDVDGGSALCVTCGNGTYEQYCNIAAMCAPCDPRCVQRYTVMVKGCTLYNNIVCECEEGRYMDPGQVCLTHSKCSAGFGMVKLGNTRENTECKECVDGQTYSNGESFERCSICTKCLEYITTCSTTEDAKCSLPWEDTSTKPSTSTEKSPGTRYLLIEVIIAAAVPSCVLLVVLLALVCKAWRQYRNGNYAIQTGNGNQQPNGQQANGEILGLIRRSEEVQPIANGVNSQHEENETHGENGVVIGQVQISYPKERQKRREMTTPKREINADDVQEGSANKQTSRSGENNESQERPERRETTTQTPRRDVNEDEVQEDSANGQTVQSGENNESQERPERREITTQTPKRDVNDDEINEGSANGQTSGSGENSDSQERPERQEDKVQDGSANGQTSREGENNEIQERPERREDEVQDGSANGQTSRNGENNESQVPASDNSATNSDTPPNPTSHLPNGRSQDSAANGGDRKSTTRDSAHSIPTTLNKPGTTKTTQPEIDDQCTNTGPMPSSMDEADITETGQFNLIAQPTSVDSSEPILGLDQERQKREKSEIASKQNQSASPTMELNSSELQMQDIKVTEQLTS